MADDLKERLIERLPLWLQRIIWAQHNARVLADMEWRLSIVLEEATGGLLSKAYYDTAAMTEEIRKHIADCENVAIDEFCDDYEIDRDATEEQGIAALKEQSNG